MDSLEDIPSAYGGLEIKKKLPASDQGAEKSDFTPENSEKTSPSVADVTSSQTTNTMNENNNVAYLDNKNMTKSCSLQEFKMVKSQSEEADDVKKTLAFTIDFGDGKDVNRQRHKSILERFEQRHKRGQSLSKLEENEISRVSPVTPNKPPLSGKLPRKRIVNVPSESSISSEQDDRGTGVRLRDKSSQLRDSSKRHSWSPRSSMHENAVKSVPTSAQRFKSSVVTSALETVSKNYPSLGSSSNDPKSLDSFLCSEPPLENFPTNDGDEVVSETGTYTVDGDNYTEEQKEKMNIDKIEAILPATTPTPLQSRPIRPTCFEKDLEVIDLEEKTPSKSHAKQLPINKSHNILEVSYSHDQINSVNKPKVSYLEKLKTRVKNISDKRFQKSKSPEKQVLPSPSDLGCFTSVTTSGILSYKPTLDDKVKVTRKNSLIKATVDSSEYVQGLTKVNVPVKSVIDGEKVEANKPHNYQLNIFNNNNTSSDSPKASTDDEECTNNTVTQVLKTASNKKDWIQEWARNAREYSGKKSNIMTRSYDKNIINPENNMRMSSSEYYDSEDPSDGPSSYGKKQVNARTFKNNTIGDNEYSSDPNLRYREYQNARRKQYDYERGQLSDFGPVTSPSRNVRNAMLYGSDDEHFLQTTILRKPPMSPSKIPSPLNTMARPRSVSRTRGSLHGSSTNLDDEADIHLQNTAAAISALANLQRRSSLRESFKNNSLRNSPRSPLSPQHCISPNLISPIDDDFQQKFNAPHRRLQQHLRSQSGGNSNAELELYQDYIRRRRPSADRYEQDIDQTQIYCHGFEDDADECAENIVIVEKGQIVAHRTPSSPVASFNKKRVSEQPVTRNSPLKAYPSPIKRSSSFSVKNQVEQKLPTTPRLQQRSQQYQRSNNPIQKSASSTSFKTMMRYEDDDCEFYINNNDNLNPDPDYSSNSSVDDSNEKEPITNTRYNKAFLMRVEQSKKAIAGPPQTKTGQVACPNTPQMARRDAKIRLSMRDRTSMPRDSSLNRLKEDVSSLASAKKRLNEQNNIMSRSAGSNALSTPSGKVLPKYLDISKYKSPQGQGQNFLKKDETKSYLNKTEVKRTPSSASVIGTRNEMARTSIRSVKSAGSKPGVKKLPDPVVAVAQEVKKQELEMWKRRAKYDPMKAAAEGKRKQEEARKQIHQERLSKNFESSVLRSQSFHCGVGGQGTTTGKAAMCLVNSPSNYNMVGVRKSIGSGNNQWTSTESSDIDDDFNTNTS
uniref:CSON001823 protein n=1 Tax=Culicoides sonorensis TaxID=179676 RepID=A0A336LRZ3_CULSO